MLRSERTPCLKVLRKSNWRKSYQTRVIVKYLDPYLFPIPVQPSNVSERYCIFIFVKLFQICCEFSTISEFDQGMQRVVFIYKL